MQSLNRPSGDDVDELNGYLRNGVFDNKLAAIASLKTAVENLDKQSKAKSKESSFELPSPIPHVQEPNNFFSIDNELYPQEIQSPN